MLEMKEQEQWLELQKKIIEEERQRLLQEHAPKLLGYLPKVRKESEVKSFVSRVAQRLA